MKNKPAIKGLVISILAFIFAFGVYFLFLKKSNEYLVDNPTSNTYYFSINKGQEKIIAAGQTLKIDLQKGNNSIKVLNSDKKVMYDSAFKVNKLRGLLNIAHEDYVINTQYYGYNLDRDSLMMALGKSEIDGKLYLGAPIKMNKLYSEDFYFNINEEYDGVIKNIQKVESRNKIFRKQDFINYYKEYYKL